MEKKKYFNKWKFNWADKRNHQRERMNKNFNNVKIVVQKNKWKFSQVEFWWFELGMSGKNDWKYCTTGDARKNSRKQARESNRLRS